MQKFDELLREVLAAAPTHTTPVQQLASELGVSHSTLRTWLAGKDLPSKENLEKIASWLENQGVKPRTFLENTWQLARDNPDLRPAFSVCLEVLLRKGGRWTRRELSLALSVSEDAVARWEQGKTLPTDVEFDNLLALLNASLAAPWDHLKGDDAIGSGSAYRRPLNLGDLEMAEIRQTSRQRILEEELRRYEPALDQRARREFSAPKAPWDLDKKEAPSIGPPVEFPARRRGRALFRVPRAMWTEVSELAELRLTANDKLTVAMRAALEKTMVGRGLNTEEFEVDPIGHKMRAVLLGDESYFKVDPLSTETQALTDKPLHWDWRVTPKREGQSTLTLRISMTSDVPDAAAAIDAQALHQPISITVKSWATRPTRFVRDNWKWMLGSSGIGAAAAIYALLQN